jgi:hypothetical protein
MKANPGKMKRLNGLVRSQPDSDIEFTMSQKKHPMIFSEARGQA